MSECQECDERIRKMALHPPETGSIAAEECSACGTVIGLIDARGGKPKRYFRDADGVVFELMDVTGTHRGDRLWLRPIDGGREQDVAPDSVTPCDRDGDDMPTGEPS